MRRDTRLLMGMPITVEVVDATATAQTIESIYSYFQHIDAVFSTYKPTSEISQINAGLARPKWSPAMKTVMRLCEQTKQQTDGYFDIAHNGQLDPSGLVKGWAIHQAAQQLQRSGFKNFYIDAGGDIQVSGHNAKNQPWVIGIRNPFNRQQVIKRLQLTTKGVATSGTAIRGQHIYNPHQPQQRLEVIVSLTVIGPNIYEADRFATAAFAMGRAGITFIEQLAGFEGYMIDNTGKATMTTGLERDIA